MVMPGGAQLQPMAIPAGAQFFVAAPPQPGLVMMPADSLRGVRWPDEVPPPTHAPGEGASSSGPASQNSSATNQVQVERMEMPEKAVEGAGDEPPPPSALTRSFSINSGAFRVNWTVSALKLKSADKNAVSPPFELSFGSEKYKNTKFKLMLFPKVNSEGRGGSSFKKSKGKGFIQLKCEADLHEEVCGTLRFRLFVSNQAPRGPVTHDFSDSAVKGLPKDLEVWDLDKAVTNGCFTVGAEIFPYVQK